MAVVEQHFVDTVDRLKSLDPEKKRPQRKLLASVKYVSFVVSFLTSF